MAAFLAAGTTDAQSSDFTLAAGESATLFLVDAAGPGLPSDALVDVQIKSAGNEYFTIGSLTYNVPALVLSAAGTYRLNRHASASVGVDKS